MCMCVKKSEPNRADEREIIGRDVSNEELVQFKCKNEIYVEKKAKGRK